MYTVTVKTVKDGTTETHEIDLPTLTQASKYITAMALMYTVIDSWVTRT